MDLKKMRLISYVWGGCLFLLVAGLTAIGFVYKNKVKKYETLENKVQDALKKYSDEKFIYPEEGAEVKVTYQELKSNNYIDNLINDDEECDGYGLVLHVNGAFKYQAYVKCNDYKTKNYDKN